MMRLLEGVTKDGGEITVKKVSRSENIAVGGIVLIFRCFDALMICVLVV